ncbi:MAG: adenylosuccinate lyase [Firmicutes bacterium]|nr:adenylosuccinate lyase [Bacillota bacterium]
MIERYTRPEMGRIWEAENRFQNWLDIEVLACEAWAALGKIPAEAVEEIKGRARFDVQRIDEIEAVTRHDVLAFTTCVAEFVGEASKYIHLGLTSSDVLDTGLALQMKQAAGLLIQGLERLKQVLATKAREYKYTLMMGRTHGVHAEPVTFGLKMALWYAETERSIERMKRAEQVISVGKISGAVGTFANIDPRVEEYVCEKLGLSPAPVSTQIIQRDRHAEYLTTLCLVASSLEKFATEVRNLQRTELLEVEEAFAKGQKGSSAMPHKRNPINAERVVGLSRVIRGNALVALENVSLWHERDLTHSSSERVIIPDSTILLDYILARFTDIMENLQVYPENMLDNLNRTLGLIFSQRLMLSMVDRGVMRETAYQWTQRNALEAWRTKEEFIDLVLRDADIMGVLTPEEVKSLFNYEYHTKYVDHIFQRVGLG